MTHLKLRLDLAAAAALAALAILGLIAAPAFARTSLSVNLNIGGPGVEWSQQPAMVLVPGTQISWVQGYSDADVYEYGSLWYCYRGGRWYRSPGYRGPWAVVSGGSVPGGIAGVRGGYHHFDHGVAAVSSRGHARKGGFRRDPIGDRSQRGNHGMPGNPGNPANTGQPSHPGNPAQPNGHAGPGNSGHPGGKDQPGGPNAHGTQGQGSRSDGGDSHR